MALTIVEQTPDGEHYYLNHSCLNTLSFGAEEMAWWTNSQLEADLMLKAVIKKHGSYFTDSAYYVDEWSMG